MTIKTLSSEYKYTARIFKVRADKIQMPDQSESVYSVVEHPGAVVILPKLGEKLLLVNQYRHALGKWLLEFPAGTLELGESPEACAKREIIEEVGYKADKLVSLGQVYPAPGFCNEVQHLFFAECTEVAFAEKDSDEIIEVVEKTVSEFEEEIANQSLLDSKSIAIFTRARLLKLI